MKFATMPRLRNVTAALLVGLALHLAAGTAAPAADLIGTHGDWKAYRHGSGDMLLCYAVTSASEQLPPGGNRQKPHIYITAWPKAGIKTEISVLVGTVLRRGAEIKIDVGGSSFSLQPDGDRAFVVDQVEEQRLLEAMRRGKVLTVAITTAPGETMRDIYSLSGVTAAVQAAAAGCQ